MVRGKTLTGIERGKIVELHIQNLSQRVIASEIIRSKALVNFLKDPDAHGTIKTYF